MAKMMIGIRTHTHCVICNKPLDDSQNFNATTCRGKWIGGSYIRSKCDKQRRRDRSASIWKHLTKKERQALVCPVLAKERFALKIRKGLEDVVKLKRRKARKLKAREAKKARTVERYRLTGTCSACGIFYTKSPHSDRLCDDCGSAKRGKNYMNNCLVCGISFTGTTRFNRICDKCKGN